MRVPLLRPSRDCRKRAMLSRGLKPFKYSKIAELSNPQPFRLKDSCEWANVFEHVSPVIGQMRHELLYYMYAMQEMMKKTMLHPDMQSFGPASGLVCNSGALVRGTEKTLQRCRGL